MNSELNPEFDEVLLTAYLDDEVTDVERAQVEEQLRTSDASRKLLAELRSVRNLVVQLHMSQPSRTFQQGPWSDSIGSDSSPKVVRSFVDNLWKVSLTRLASIAALVAIVACVSVLIVEPNRNSMTLSENSKTDNSTADNSTKGRTREAASSEPAKDMPIDVLAKEANNQPMPSELSSTFTRSQPTETQSNSLGRSQLGYEAPADVARASKSVSEEGLLGSGFGKSGMGGPAAMGSSGPAGLSGTARFGDTAGFGDTREAVYLAPDRSEWQVLDRDSATAATAATAATGRQNALTEDLIQAEGVQMDGLQTGNAESSKTQLSNTRYYRFQGTKSNEKVVKEKTELAGATDLSMRSAAKKDEKPLTPFFVEFQVPADEWYEGAVRLRQMGIEVPLELPQADQLEFIEVPTARDTARVPDSNFARAPVNRFDSDSKEASPTGTLGLKFRSLELQPNSTLLESTADKNSVPTKNGRELQDAVETIRIRVRILKKQ